MITYPQPLPDFRAMLQELGPAFEKTESYTLTEDEVELVYLSLCRLDAIEAMAIKRDWDGLSIYCPVGED